MITPFLKAPSFLTLSLVLVEFMKIPSKDRLTVSMLCHNPASFLKSRTFTMVSPKTNIMILTFEIQNTQLCCKNCVLFIRRKMKKTIVVFGFNVYKKLGLWSDISHSSAFIGVDKDWVQNANTTLFIPASQRSMQVLNRKHFNCGITTDALLFWHHCEEA